MLFSYHVILFFNIARSIARSHPLAPGGVAAEGIWLDVYSSTADTCWRSIIARRLAIPAQLGTQEFANIDKAVKRHLAQPSPGWHSHPLGHGSDKQGGGPTKQNPFTKFV